MDFTDVSLHDAAEQIHLDGKHLESFVNITRNDIEQLWESANDGDSRFSRSNYIVFFRIPMFSKYTYIIFFFNF